MQIQDYWLILAFFALVLLPAPLLGCYLFRVMEGQRTWPSPLLIPVERLCCRVTGVDSAAEQGWKPTVWRCWPLPRRA
jgi:K+-transporting ATPase ATPase A chain